MGTSGSGTSNATSSGGSKVATWILALCAIVLTSLVVRREFGQPPPPPPPGLATVEIPNWTEVAADGHADGPAGAPIQLVVFEDFECPACQYFATTSLPPVLEEFQGKIRVIRRHSPLPYHKLAYPAARAAECAAAQGKFLAMHALLFEKSDSLGLKSFESFATESGIADLETFRACNAISDSLDTIRRDWSVARATGARGTPAVVINGKLFSRPPDSDQLRQYVRDLLGTK